MVTNTGSVQSRVQYAKGRGRLRPQPCERCGAAENIHAHHEDYSKPLDVTWLCPSCHGARHSELRGMFSARRLAQILGIPFQKTTLRRRRVEAALRDMAAGGSATNCRNQLQSVLAKCRDIAAMQSADPAMFAEFVAATLHSA